MVMVMVMTIGGPRQSAVLMATQRYVTSTRYSMNRTNNDALRCVAVRVVCQCPYGTVQTLRYATYYVQYGTLRLAISLSVISVCRHVQYGIEWFIHEIGSLTSVRLITVRNIIARAPGW